MDGRTTNRTFLGNILIIQKCSIASKPSKFYHSFDFYVYIIKNDVFTWLDEAVDLEVRIFGMVLILAFGFVAVAVVAAFDT